MNFNKKSIKNSIEQQITIQITFAIDWDKVSNKITSVINNNKKYLKSLISDEKAHVFGNLEINAFTWDDRIIYIDEVKRKQKNDYD